MQEVPQSGGSYIRDKDGSLHLVVPEPETPETPNTDGDAGSSQPSADSGEQPKKRK